MSHSILKTHGICNLSIIPVRANPTDEAEIVTQLLFGDYITVIEKGSPWIKIKNNADGYEGWIDFKQLTYIDQTEFDKGTSNGNCYVVKQPSIQVSSTNGLQTIFFGSVLPFFNENNFKIGNTNYEVLTQLTIAKLQPYEYAQFYINTPYLWGGKSLHGIDCSALIQNTFKPTQFSIPRDASMQVYGGELIHWKDRKVNDLVFFKSKSGNVTHVGILVTKNTIIHAHGKVRIDKIDEKGIWNNDLEWYSHLTYCTKRF